MITVTGIECLRCHHVLVSRAGHDMHGCPCGVVQVDGGRDYLRVVGDLEAYRAVRVDLQADDAKELVEDWRAGTRKYTSFPPETHFALNVRGATAEEITSP
jgi:hypothetical protein